MISLRQDVVCMYLTVNLIWKFSSFSNEVIKLAATFISVLLFTVIGEVVALITVFVQVREGFPCTFVEHSTSNKRCGFFSGRRRLFIQVEITVSVFHNDVGILLVLRGWRNISERGEYEWFLAFKLHFLHTCAFENFAERPDQTRIVQNSLVQQEHEEAQNAAHVPDIE